MTTPSQPLLTCPACGNPLGTGANCPACRLNAGGRADNDAEAPLPCSSDTSSPRPQAPPFQFGLSSLLLITTLAAVIMSVSVMVPGVGILLAILATPALIRTYVLVRRSRADGKPAPTQEKFVLFITCLGISALIALGTGAAFFVTCLVGLAGGAAASGGGWRGLDTGMTVGMILGTFVGLIVLILFLVKWFKHTGRSAKRQDYTRPDYTYPAELPPGNDA